MIVMLSRLLPGMKRRISWRNHHMKFQIFKAMYVKSHRDRQCGKGRSS